MFISAKEMIAYADTILPLSSIPDFVLLEWIRAAILEIGVPVETFGVQVKTFDNDEFVNDGKITTWRLEDVRSFYRAYVVVGDTLKECRLTGLATPFSAGANAIRRPAMYSDIDYEFKRSGKEIFLTNTTLNPTMAIFEYIGLLLDEEGEPLVPEIYREAVFQALNRNVTLRSFKRDMRGKINFGEVVHERQEFRIQKGSAFGRASMPDIMTLETKAAEEWAKNILHLPRPML